MNWAIVDLGEAAAKYKQNNPSIFFRMRLVGLSTSFCPDTGESRYKSCYVYNEVVVTLTIFLQQSFWT